MRSSSSYLDSYLNQDENYNTNNHRNNRELDLVDLLLNRLEKRKQQQQQQQQQQQNLYYIRKNGINENDANQNLMKAAKLNSNANEYDYMMIETNSNNQEMKVGNPSDRLENPFFVDYKKNGLNKLFLNSDSDGKYFMDDFTTDTQIESLAGLTLWQFTALFILFLIFLGLLVILLKKASLYSKNFSFTTRFLKHSQFKNSLSRSVKLSSYFYRRSINANHTNNIKNDKRTSNNSIINSSTSTEQTTTADSNNQLASSNYLLNNKSNLVNAVSSTLTANSANISSSEHYKSLPNFV